MNMRYSLLVLMAASLATIPVQTLSASVYMGSATVTDSDTAETDTVYGSAEYTNVRRTGLSVGGRLNFTALNVDGPVEVAGRATGTVLTCGPLTIRGAPSDATHITCTACSVSGSCTVDTMDCDSLSVHGRLTATNLTVHNTLTVFGHTHATNSTIGTVTLYASDALFSNTTLKTLTVKKASEGFSQWFGWFGNVLRFFFTAEEKRQTVTLTGATEVNGDIIFEHDGGVVKCAPTAHVAGSVIGGTLVKTA